MLLNFHRVLLTTAALWLGWCNAECRAKTVALWLFDEQVGIYPSCVLGDAASGDFPLVIGCGGQIVAGKFGNALEPLGRPEVEYPKHLVFDEPEKRGQFGLTNRTSNKAKLMWTNANFCALMTRGQRHLRQEVNFGSPTTSALNLGVSDWTLEFWYRPMRGSQRPATVLEIGTGPRAVESAVTRLSMNADAAGFTLVNVPGNVRLNIDSSPLALDASRSQWHHFAFVYDKSTQQLRHYVDGVIQSLPNSCSMEPLAPGEQDYLTIGRSGRWEYRLPGRLDEMRISSTRVYQDGFEPPPSFSNHPAAQEPPPLKKGPPLLFATDKAGQPETPIPLGSRKHLFLDDALLAEQENITFRPNPPRKAELVVEQRGLSNHLVVFEDVESGDGLIRLYRRGPNNSLSVWTSADGVVFDAPDLGREFQGAHNIVIEDPVGLGTLFLDPNAPTQQRIKYFSGYRGRGCYVYSSADGYQFTRNETSALPFRAASQSIVFYDDQRQRYVGYHRSDMQRTVGGKSSRTSVMTEATDVMRPWPWQAVSVDEQRRLAKTRPLGRKIPYYVDNGPLTPPGFGVEYPTTFANTKELDPVGVDVYVPKSIKYPWAADAYLAFPVMYFHYHGDGPETRQALGRPAAARGSGPLESQLAVSRDGIRWQRYPRPTYVGIGRHAGLDLKKAYMGHGMVRRGNEIWQYYVGSEKYHSPWTKSRSAREAIFRVVQRFDGFVSADTPYTGGSFTTRPLIFEGNRLVLNLDTDAAGYAQVGFLDERGKPIEGFSIDDCIYLNGDFIATEVEWLNSGKDLSLLAGRTVQVVFRSRGTKLYSMQFTKKAS